MSWILAKLADPSPMRRSIIMIILIIIIIIIIIIILIIIIIIIIKNLKKINLWLTAPKGATPAN